MSQEHSCGDCGSQQNVLFIHQRCHPNEPIQASINKTENVIRIECALCERLVAAYKIDIGGRVYENQTGSGANNEKIKRTIQNN